MYNVKALLEEGVFKTTEECRAEGVKKQSAVTVLRTIGRPAPVKYHVTDTPPAAKDTREWARVVAVFTLVRSAVNGRGRGWPRME